MKTLTAVLTIATLSLAAGLAQARDLSPDETLKLQDAGTIQSIEKLEAAALVLHPGGKAEDAELEEEYGRYIYQVEIRDAQGVQWDVELDATNAQVLKNQRDD